jgi:hypothetical protein
MGSGAVRVQEETEAKAFKADRFRGDRSSSPADGIDM